MIRRGIRSAIALIGAITAFTMLAAAPAAAQYPE